MLVWDARPGVSLGLSVESFGFGVVWALGFVTACVCVRKS